MRQRHRERETARETETVRQRHGERQRSIICISIQRIYGYECDDTYLFMRERMGCFNSTRQRQVD